MSTVRLEDRVNELETKYSELSDELAKLSEKVTRSPGTEEPWWKRIVGIYKDDPLFEEAERYRLEYRASLDRQDEDNEAGS